MNLFQDCRSIRQGSINDSDVVEDYRKEKTQFGSPQTSIMKKVGDMHQSMSMELGDMHQCNIFDDETFKCLIYQKCNYSF